MSKITKIKGMKFYGLLSKGENKFLNWTSDNIEYPKKHLSEDMPFLVEIEITKVYTMNPLIIEVKETE